MASKGRPKHKNQAELNFKELWLVLRLTCSKLCELESPNFDPQLALKISSKLNELYEILQESSYKNWENEVLSDKDKKIARAFAKVIRNYIYANGTDLQRTKTELLQFCNSNHINSEKAALMIDSALKSKGRTEKIKKDFIRFAEQVMANCSLHKPSGSRNLSQESSKKNNQMHPIDQIINGLFGFTKKTKNYFDSALYKEMEKDPNFLYPAIPEMEIAYLKKKIEGR